ncbi:MAG TPA: ATP-binding protein [Gammaproteobacteria bacterium]
MKDGGDAPAGPQTALGAFRESERTFVELVEQMPFGVYVVDADFRISYMNPGSRNVAFRNIRPVIGRPFDEAVRILWPEPVATEVITVFRRTLDTGEPYRSENFVNPRADVDEIERYEWEVHRIELPDGRHGVVCYFFDSTKLRDTKRALVESQLALAGQKEAFQAAMDGRPLASCLDVLVRTAVRHFGGAARAGFYMRGDAAGEGLHHVVGMSDAYAQDVDGLRIGPDSFGCGLAMHIGEPVISADVERDPLWESWRWLARAHGFRSCWSFPLQASGGPVLGTFALYFREPRAPADDDIAFIATLAHAAAIITSRHKEAEERARAERALREADRRKDEFLATLAHELRNPLAPLVSSLDYLDRIGSPDPNAAGIRAIMRRQLAQLVRLVDDLLDVSRITRGRLDLRRQRVELADVMRSAVETCAPLIEQHEHELVVTFSPEPIWLDADPVRLAQVLANLLNNACRYTPDQGRVWLIAERRDGDAVVTVRDSGIGISPGELDEVFDLFSQGSDRSLERKHSGLGVGLHLVKRLVELHGGTVTAHSEGRGKGAEFVVRLPAAAESGDAEGAAPPSEVDSPDVRIRRARILVVDDNPDSARALAQLLAHGGHETAIAGDGMEALESTEAFRPDVILMDIGMPRMNGYDACRAIRARSWGQRIRIVALTGWGHDADRDKTAAAGFDAHLVKPVDLRALNEVLATDRCES